MRDQKKKKDPYLIVLKLMVMFLMTKMCSQSTALLGGKKEKEKKSPICDCIEIDGYVLDDQDVLPVYCPTRRGGKKRVPYVIVLKVTI